MEPHAAVASMPPLLLGALRRWSPSLADVWSGQGPPPSLDGLTEHLVAHRQPIASWLGALQWEGGEGEGWAQAPHRWLRRALVGWLLRKHQFLQLDSDVQRRLDMLHGRLLGGVGRVLASSAPDGELPGALQAACEAHRRELAGLLSGLLGPCPREVVSSEYTPTLQLDVLGLTLADLREPILDVGCGAEAALVGWLRGQGLDAHGIDRDAPDELATRADWLAYPFGVERWGTVLSHQGFSLHFLHHHLARAPAAAHHAQAYMRILRSLRPGGQFAYAPAVPFFEALLPPDTYRCRHTPLPPSMRTPALASALAATGLPLDQATRIERIPLPTAWVNCRPAQEGWSGPGPCVLAFGSAANEPGAEPKASTDGPGPVPTAGGSRKKPAQRARTRPPYVWKFRRASGRRPR